MKRPFNPSKNYHVKMGDIKSDFTSEQLYGIGAVAMNYNEVESTILTLFCQVSGLSEALQLEVFTRINGIDGIIEIIKVGARDIGVDANDIENLNDALGAGGFKLLKQYRDAVVHARALNAPMGVGVRLDRRATAFEVLMTTDALKGLYDHLTALRLELRDATYLMLTSRDLQTALKTQPADDPNIALLATGKSVTSARFREHRQRRQSLPPLPEFPSELQLIEARDKWWRERIAEQTAAIQQMNQNTPHQA